MRVFKNVVILSGAGLSAESGISTFRDKGGIWANYDYRDVATPEGFERNPQLVRDFYNQRRRANAAVKPNAAHLALALLEARFPGEALVVTQNIDALHEAAGTKHLLHMHGEIAKALCAHCGDRQHIGHRDIQESDICPACGREGGMRPDVVWFGEMPYHMEHIQEALMACDLFISIGTSGTVYPAAGFVAQARASGAHTVELNLEPSQSASLFHETIHGLATEIVPSYVAWLLGARR